MNAVGLNKIARFRFDPRDQHSDEDFYELIGDDNGVFGCMSLLGCHDVCPKNLPLSTQIAILKSSSFSPRSHFPKLNNSPLWFLQQCEENRSKV